MRNITKIILIIFMLAIVILPVSAQVWANEIYIPIVEQNQVRPLPTPAPLPRVVAEMISSVIDLGDGFWMVVGQTDPIEFSGGAQNYTGFNHFEIAQPVEFPIEFLDKPTLTLTVEMVQPDGNYLMSGILANSANLDGNGFEIRGAFPNFEDYQKVLFIIHYQAIGQQ